MNSPWKPVGYVASVLTFPSILMRRCMTIEVTSRPVKAYFSLLRRKMVRGRDSRSLWGPGDGRGAYIAMNRLSTEIEQFVYRYAHRSRSVCRASMLRERRDASSAFWVLGPIERQSRVYQQRVQRKRVQRESRRGGVVRVHPPTKSSIQPIQPNITTSPSPQQRNSLPGRRWRHSTDHVDVLAVLTLTTATASSFGLSTTDDCARCSGCCRTFTLR